MSLKIKFLKFRLKYLSRFSGKYDFNEILKLEGIEVGKGTIFYGPKTMCIDRTLPHMIKIGDYCKITSGVVILAHDYSYSVLVETHKEIVGNAGKTIIGNNVFIGINAIILMGTKIGNNVIVGAGSVVHGEIPNNVVIAGNPAKIICSIDEYYKKLKNRCYTSAKEYFLSFKEKYGRIPKENEMERFFPLFSKDSIELLKKKNINLVFNGVDPFSLNIAIANKEPIFCSYNEFVNSIINNIEI